MAQIQNLTGTIRANGGAVLCFIGPADRAIEWRIVLGAGALFPFANFTNAQGQCACRYEAGGYLGPLTIGVAYVA